MERLAGTHHDSPPRLKELIARLCEPSSELYVAEQWCPRTALPDLLVAPAARVDDNRLYRALDQQSDRPVV